MFHPCAFDIPLQIKIRISRQHHIVVSGRYRYRTNVSSHALWFYSFLYMTTSYSLQIELDNYEWEIQISDKCLIPCALVLQQGLWQDPCCRRPHRWSLEDGLFLVKLYCIRADNLKNNMKWFVSCNGLILMAHCTANCQYKMYWLCVTDDTINKEGDKWRHSRIFWLTEYFIAMFQTKQLVLNIFIIS